ncbi:MBL fold metallo-hydrolase [Hymenobacter aquaticus]|uniref:MBL fold metallo-hydrolase n=1 Tax=Hymenobacter aquaticus TaxID=1867101 RepID=A0A4Z0Q4C7_9BACT|nr:MBL fold metallo-hydrolase [Hymenobacter aquaticus]TGE24336.1 MBL fold metallo-hydrolase [Hymenobacter aquaticus]
MAWELAIHTFDVGQGESALLVARDPAVAPVAYKTMLIDGGIAAQGALVAGCIDAILPANVPVDHILVTHYDVDHSGGIMSLLAADNFFQICDTIARIAIAEANMGINRPQQIAAGAAGTCAALIGAYALPGSDDSMYAISAGMSARAHVVPTTTDADAALWGMQEAESVVGNLPANPWLIPHTSTKKRREVARRTGVFIADTLVNPAIVGAAAIRVAVRQFVFAQLGTLVKEKNCNFSTGGRFSTTHMIDTGNASMPNKYDSYVNGQLLLSSQNITAPNVNRQRTTAALGDEILWNSGPNAAVPVANAPMVFVVAVNKYMWRGDPNRMPIALAEENNSDSYGLVVRFNKFFFYTGGDLPTSGEELIAQAVMTNGLPIPGTANQFALPHCIAAFKCGHHGATTCTSDVFLNGQVAPLPVRQGIRPRAALISCGHPGTNYYHPDQPLINRLQACGSLDYCFLTGFQVDPATLQGPKIHVPASLVPAVLQYPGPVGNKMYVSGNAAAQYGHISLSINEDESASNSPAYPLGPGDAALRQFHITYWEEDTHGGFLTVHIPF